MAVSGDENEYVSGRSRMRIWEDDCSKLGCTMAAGPVLANGAPDDTAAEECRALGGALA